MVNVDKSSIIFSSNAPEEVRRKIEQVLGVKVVKNPCTYLGTLSLWGKTRCEALGYVRERVEKKIDC